jgi:plasmid stability protein
MGNLVVRGLDDRIVQALKRRAAEHQRSAEAEHRAILEDALIRPPRRPLAEVLVEMPDAGEDGDFERRDEDAGGDVFD